MHMDEFSKRFKDLMEFEGLSKRAISLKINVDRASVRLWKGYCRVITVVRYKERSVTKRWRFLYQW